MALWHTSAGHAVVLHEKRLPPHAEESQQEKHCDSCPKYVELLAQAFFSGPLVQTYGLDGVHGFAWHSAWVHVVQTSSQECVSQQAVHCGITGQ